MKVKVYTLNAFAEQENGGNPAGVVLDADELTKAQMLRIAKEVNFSETAFVMKSDKADFRVRFFTPTEEVDFCGHATVGTFYLLNHLGWIPDGKYKQETKAGVLSVEVRDGLVVMEQRAPRFLEKLTTRNPDFEAVCQSLGIETGDVGVRPIVDEREQGNFINHMEIVTTGLSDLIIPLRSIEILHSLRPNMKMIAEISRKIGITGYHIFAMSDGEVTVQCRNLAPAVGIDEESATGSSSGALGCFLIKNRIINIEQKNVAMIFEQGLTMGKLSRLYINIIKEAPWGNRIEAVYVGGRANNVEDMEVVL